jgi:rod shape-determining protein MreD
MRLLLFFLLLLMAQGFLGVLLAPLAAPDLFLLALIALLWRIQPWNLILIAYATGLFQDLLGHGHLGVHALGLAGAMMGAVLIRSQFTSSEVLSRVLAVGMAMVCKWLAIVPLVVWQSGSLGSLKGILSVMPAELLLTFLTSFVIVPWAEALLEKTRLLRRELL